MELWTVVRDDDPTRVTLELRRPDGVLIAALSLPLGPALFDAPPAVGEMLDPFELLERRGFYARRPSRP